MAMELDISPLNLPGIPFTRPLIVAGPCSAETEEQTLQTAHALQARGIKVFRAGVWKPRTKPGCFEGNGRKALPWLQRVKRETGMLTCIEVATSQHVGDALEAGVDILWIGARTAANPFAVQEIADSLRGVDIPVFYKNPVNADLELWIGGMQRINQAGVKRLAAVHRGFSSYEKTIYRNTPAWHIPIELRRRIPQLLLLCDPSHLGGKREYVAPLSQQAMDLGFDGLMVECHCCPEKAWSDASQQLNPAELSSLLDALVIRSMDDSAEWLKSLRGQIDDLDNDLIRLLSRRMSVSREIARYKKENNVTVVQPLRYNEIISGRGAQGVLSGMSPQFVKTIFETIHTESVRQQIEIINNKEK